MLRVLGSMLGISLALIPLAGHASPAPAPIAGPRAIVGAPVAVNLFGGKGGGSGSQGTRLSKPFLQMGRASSKTLSQPAERVASIQVAAPDLAQLASITLDSFDAQVGAFGADQAAEPP